MIKALSMKGKRFLFDFLFQSIEFGRIEKFAQCDAQAITNHFDR